MWSLCVPNTVPLSEDLDYIPQGSLYLGHLTKFRSSLQASWVLWSPPVSECDVVVMATQEVTHSRCLGQVI